MKIAADSKRVLVTVPLEVREWLEQRARYNGGTMSSEVTRALRARMEQDRVEKDRTVMAGA